MNNEKSDDYERLIQFWNSAFVMDHQQRQHQISQIDPEQDWKEMAPSQKLLDAALALGRKEKVLDYGCGDGWAAIACAKGGCRNVTCVDTSENAAEMARFYADIFHVGDSVDTHCISTSWLKKQDDESFDGIICSNVLDVIPQKASEEIIKQMSRVLTDDGEVVIGLNYYMVPKENEERHITVKNENCVYIDGILRLVSMTDEQWKAMFEQYFTVESLDYFAWPNEQQETRRLFRLKKR